MRKRGASGGFGLAGRFGFAPGQRQQGDAVRLHVTPESGEEVGKGPFFRLNLERSRFKRSGVGRPNDGEEGRPAACDNRAPRVVTPR
jgi:hypothetical protein